MNDKCLISIIVPIYNVDNYLSKCIDSIINQTYKNLEIILVDDGSTDNSGLICDNYKNKDARIVVIHQENKGLSCARNKGLDIAKGDLIGFVDSDDYLEPNFYEILKNTMDYQKSDLVISNIYFIKNNKKTINKVESQGKCFVYSGKEKYNNLINSYGYITLVAWNKLYKKELFNNLRYPEGKLYEDAYIICDLLKRCKKVSYILEPLYNYVYRFGSIVNSFTLNHFDKITSQNKIIDFLNSMNYCELATNEKHQKAYTLIINLSKMKIYHINNKEIYDKYYNELVITSKELKWKDSNKYVKRFKVFKRFYILSRSYALGLYYKIKSII